MNLKRIANNKIEWRKSQLYDTLACYMAKQISWDYIISMDQVLNLKENNRYLEVDIN